MPKSTNVSKVKQYSISKLFGEVPLNMHFFRKEYENTEVISKMLCSEIENIINYSTRTRNINSNVIP